MNKELIKQQIKELDTNNIIKDIKISDYFDNGCFISLCKKTDKVEMIYNDDGLNICNDKKQLYIKNKKDNIPLIIFAYENKGKIEDYIKSELATDIIGNKIKKLGNISLFDFVIVQRQDGYVKIIFKTFSKVKPNFDEICFLYDENTEDVLIMLDTYVVYNDEKKLNRKPLIEIIMFHKDEIKQIIKDNI